LTARLLILDAGGAPATNLMRSLKAGDPSLVIIGCSESRFFLNKSLAERNYVLPFSTARYRTALRRIVEAEDINLVIPTSDSDVRRIGAMRTQLGRRTFLPSNALIQRCQDKFKLTHFLRRRGIPAPRTYPVSDLASIEGIFKRFDSGKKLWCRIRSGTGSFGAVPVRTSQQVRGWMHFWESMRSVPPHSFTLSEYLPGRDYCVQCLWKDGRLILAKMAERITYLESGSPSGVSSMPALAKTVFDSKAIDVCRRAISALDARASGIFFVDLKENEEGEPCITEINAGRFATMTNIHDLVGKHNMAVTYVRVALGAQCKLDQTVDYAEGYYLVRSVDTQPAIVHKSDLFRGIRNA
jgi:biotin carboxylase